MNSLLCCVIQHCMRKQKFLFVSSMPSVIALLFYKKYWHEYTKEKTQSFNGLFLMLMIVFISMHPTIDCYTCEDDER